LDPVRSADPPIVGNCGIDCFKRHFRRLACRHRFQVGEQLIEIGLEPAVAHLTVDPRQELVLLAAPLQAILPLRMVNRAALSRRAPGGQNVVGDFERGLIPAELDAGRGHFVSAKCGAVGCRRPLLVGSAEADDRLAADQARPRVGERFLDRAIHVVCVETVALAGVPLAGLIAGEHVLVAR